MKSRIRDSLLGNRRDEPFAERFARIGSGRQSTAVSTSQAYPEMTPRPDKADPKPGEVDQQRDPAAKPVRSAVASTSAKPAPPVLPEARNPLKSTGNSGPARQVTARAANSGDPIELVLCVVRSALPPVLTFSVIINLLMLTGPLFMLQVYDRALPSGSVATLAILFMLVTILYLFFALLDGVRGRIFIRLGTRIDEILHKPVYRALLRLSGRDPDGGGPQPLRDLESVRGYVSGTGPAAFFDIPWVPVYLGLIFLMHPLLGVFSVIAAAVLVTVALLNKRLTQQGHGEVARAAFDAHRFAEEGRRDAPAAQALGMQPSLVEEWTRRKDEAIGLMAPMADRSGLFTSASKSLRLFFQSAILGLGAWLAIEQQITAGMIIAATIIMSRALAPIEQAIQQWPSFVGAQRAWERLKELFARLPAEPARRTTLPAPSGSIQVSNLACFAPAAARPVIAGIDFELEPGAGLGVIGPSGVGKSTLVKAILGIWPTISGDVRLDGAKHDQWDSAVLGRYLGYLPQQATLLPGTVAQNIARFDPQATSEAILKAAQITGAHQLAVSLPDGYDTIVGADGAQLSSGQVQRIALARAVYGMPPVLVLDEPYSNLDSDGEHALTETIRAMRDFGSTVIVVTHRSSALNALDSILCLRAGRQAFYGPKDEVLKAMTQAVPSQDNEEAGRQKVGASQTRKLIEARREPAVKAEPADKAEPARPSVVAIKPKVLQRPANAVTPSAKAERPTGAPNPPQARPGTVTADRQPDRDVPVPAIRAPDPGLEPRNVSAALKPSASAAAPSGNGSSAGAAAARERDRERLAMIRQKQAELQARMARKFAAVKQDGAHAGPVNASTQKVAHG